MRQITFGKKIEALTKRQEKLSSRVEKAFSAFEKDIKLIKERPATNWLR